MIGGIHGIGIDTVLVERIRRARARWGARFLDRVFTLRERSLCGEGPSADRRLAARFAAKEAALKALGTGLSGGLAWRDVEIVGGVDQRPSIVLHGRAAAWAASQGVARLHVSMSHDGPLATALVIAEGRDRA
ncbi:MAG TPA: holo-ACP synthase [Bacillota bacterium]